MGRLAPEALTEPRPYVELVGVTKRFGATVALDGVDVAIEPGTVHAIIGENGAGKSTLGKIVAGVLQPDAGTLIVGGQAVRFGSPRDALDKGITTIAQELSLVPARSVVENIYLGIEGGRLGFVDRRGLARRLDELMKRVDIQVFRRGTRAGALTPRAAESGDPAGAGARLPASSSWTSPPPGFRSTRR